MIMRTPRLATTRENTVDAHTEKAVFDLGKTGAFLKNNVNFIYLVIEQIVQVFFA